MHKMFLVDTKNSTYLTPQGMAILKQKPYNDLKIVVNENAIIQPTKEHSRRLSDFSSGSHSVDKENCECIPFFHSLHNMLLLFIVSVAEADEPTNVEQELEYSISSTKRRRELTGKAKEYNEQRVKLNKKKK
jgi:hypothetical protein